MRHAGKLLVRLSLFCALKFLFLFGVPLFFVLYLYSKRLGNVVPFVFKKSDGSHSISTFSSNRYLDWPTPWTNNLKADFVLPPQSNDASPLSAKRRLSTRNQLPVSSKKSKVKPVEVDALPLLKHPPWRQGGRAVHFARRRLATDGDGSKAAEVTSTSQDVTTANTAAPHLSTRTAPPQARREDSVPSTSAEKKPPKGELVGGETAMWTESVDWTNFECRVSLNRRVFFSLVE